MIARWYFFTSIYLIARVQFATSQQLPIRSYSSERGSRSSFIQDLGDWDSMLSEE